MVSCFRVLAMNASDLDIVLVSNGLKQVHSLAKLGQLDVNWGSESSAEIRRAWGNVAKALIVGKPSYHLDVWCCNA